VCGSEIGNDLRPQDSREALHVNAKKCFMPAAPARTSTLWPPPRTTRRGSEGATDSPIFPVLRLVMNLAFSG
jgi:hypothetical protein